MSNKKSKKYTYAFKEEAVRLASLPGKSAASVARELGVPAWKLRNWIKESNEKLERSWDNAVAESFFGSLKSEMIYRKFFPSRIHASTAVFEYIEIFYNLRRLHSSLGYITPWEKVQKGKRVAQSDLPHATLYKRGGEPQKNRNFTCH